MAFDADTGTYAFPETPSNCVLVVSADPALADAMTLLLEEWGYSSIVAPDPAHAVDLCRSTKPNIVLLDLMSRSADFTGLANRMSRELEDNGPPVVALHDDDDLAETLDYGPVALVRAPFRIDDLRDVLMGAESASLRWTH